MVTAILKFEMMFSKRGGRGGDNFLSENKAYGDK
jgi:hypothetical protein